MANPAAKDEGSPCLGTTTIIYEDEESIKRKKGLLAIFHEQDGDNHSLLISVLLGGSSVHHGTIKMDQVRMKLLGSIDSKSEQTTTLAGFLLDKTDDQVTVKYALQDQDNFKMAIRYQPKDEGGKTFKAWAGTLTGSKDVVQFCQTLGRGINQGQKQVVFRVFSYRIRGWV